MLEKGKSIAVISTTCLQVPPEGYGGLELMVYNLCDELSDRGYDVTCIAPQGTEIDGCDVIETVESSESQDCFSREPEAFEMYADELHEFDVVIDHSWSKLAYRAKAEQGRRMATTGVFSVFHGMPQGDPTVPVQTPCFTSVSKRASEAWSRHSGHEYKHVYNGIDFSNYEVNPDKDDYFITLNRIMSEKGIEQVMQIAHNTDVELKVVGEDSFVDNKNYVHEIMRIAANLDSMDYRGSVPDEEKQTLLQNAKAVILNPKPPYQEVFGLAAVEAFASGTPVIARDNCGLGEVVDKVQDWGTFRRVSEAERMVEQVKDGTAPTMSAEELRSEAEKYFSKKAMADIYLKRAKQARAEPW